MKEKKTVTFLLPEADYKILKDYAVNSYRSLASVAKEAIDQFIEQKGLRKLKDLSDSTPKLSKR